MADGVRILLNLNKCRGPITTSEGVEKAVADAHAAARVSVLRMNFVTFPDGTINFHSDLAESHCSGGTYLADRFVCAEISMCNESRDNTDLARELAQQLVHQFRPADFDRKQDVTEIFWKSR